MEDEIVAGDIVVVKKINNPTKLENGDVIAFCLEENSTVIHRIYDAVEEEGEFYYITKEY